MGDAVMRFIWSREELRPDASPVYPVRWEDDAYSSDLVLGFLSALEPFHTQTAFRAAASDAASDWGVVASFAALRGFPLGRLSLQSGLYRECLLPRPTNSIPFSVGTFDRPNFYEAEVAKDVLNDLDRYPLPRNPLLLLCGQSQPSRRFIRALARLSPMQTRRFVAV